jgi:hypothetical protein
MEAKPNKRPQSYPKVNQEKLDKILAEIKKGGTRKHSAEANGISGTHFHNLIAQGIVDIEFGLHDTIHARLVVSLRDIELKEIQSCRSAIRKGKTGHKGAEWTLEHAYWRSFGKDANAKELAEEIDRLREDMKQGANSNV